MVDNTTLRWLESYEARRDPDTFLMGLLNFNPRINVHNSEKVTIDVKRLRENISITQASRAGGYRDVTSELFTNKEFSPPVNADSHSLNVFELMSRQFGQNPFDDPDFVMNAREQSARNMALIADGITRTVELQTSQVLQTGAITLTDTDSNTVYTIDYGPKATHFPTVSTSWSNPAADIIGDLTGLAEVIRNDGLVDASAVIMGATAWQNTLNNTAIQARADNRRYFREVEIMPNMRGNGATLQGQIRLGNYWLDVWTYNGRYVDPATGNSVKYVDDNNVVMVAMDERPDSSLKTRIDLTYGRYLPIRQPLPEARQFIPPTITDGMVRIDTNAWFSNDGRSLTVGGGIRPLVIPVGIDTYGCLDTEV